MCVGHSFKILSVEKGWSTGRPPTEFVTFIALVLHGATDRDDMALIIVISFTAKDAYWLGLLSFRVEMVEPQCAHYVEKGFPLSVLRHNQNRPPMTRRVNSIKYRGSS